MNINRKENIFIHILLIRFFLTYPQTLVVCQWRRENQVRLLRRSEDLRGREEEGNEVMKMKMKTKTKTKTPQLHI